MQMIQKKSGKRQKADANRLIGGHTEEEENVDKREEKQEAEEEMFLLPVGCMISCQQEAISCYSNSRKPARLLKILASGEEKRSTSTFRAGQIVFSGLFAQRSCRISSSDCRMSTIKSVKAREILDSRGWVVAFILLLFNHIIVKFRYHLSAFFFISVLLNDLMMPSPDSSDR